MREIAARSSAAAARQAAYDPVRAHRARTPDHRAATGMTNKQITDESYLSHADRRRTPVSGFPQARQHAPKQLRDAHNKPRQQRSTK